MIDNDTALIDHEREETSYHVALADYTQQKTRRETRSIYNYLQPEKNNIGPSFERTQNGKQSITEARG